MCKYLRNGANQVIERKTPRSEAGVSRLDGRRGGAGCFQVFSLEGIERVRHQRAAAQTVSPTKGKAMTTAQLSADGYAKLCRVFAAENATLSVGLLPAEPFQPPSNRAIRWDWRRCSLSRQR